MKSACRCLCVLRVCVFVCVRSMAGNTHSFIHSMLIFENSTAMATTTARYTHTHISHSHMHVHMPVVCIYDFCPVWLVRAHSFPYLWFAMDFSIPDIHLSVMSTQKICTLSATHTHMQRERHTYPNGIMNILRPPFRHAPLRLSNFFN